jgi:uncharacterized protein YxjI
MKLPINFTFKILAFAPQIRVTDASGQMICYVKQKLFKLKEAVNIFRDEAQQQKLFEINADRILDFNAKYAIKSVDGREMGKISRQGARSIWRATYDIEMTGRPAFQIKEANPWMKLVDGLISGIPIIGPIISMFIHPTYNISRPDDALVAELTKSTSVFESKFSLNSKSNLGEDETTVLVAALTMFILLERARG